jgi:2-polyprenyl-3-methyl-5-hydroxy-6-metoxy-1,4-benzoquinol methylase
MGAPLDRSNGYEARAQEFITSRQQSTIGAATVARWAGTLPPGSSVIDLACGPGIPITKTLIEAGLLVHAIDASPTMVRAFAERYPQVPVACEAIEHSTFFGRSFDAAVAWGVMFLLSADRQEQVLRRVSTALSPGGRLLFTAPWQTGTWADLLTGLESVSLGREKYLQLLSAAGFTLLNELDDEGENHYYDVVKESVPRERS